MAASTIHTTEDLFKLFGKTGLLKRFGLKRLGVFGSLARGEDFNDIDVLVEDEVEYPVLIALKNFLERETGHRVDIVSSKYSEPLIFGRALREVKRYAA